MKKTLLAAALLLPLTLSACSGFSPSLALGAVSLLTDVCYVNKAPQIVSIGAQGTKIDVAYYRADLTLAHRQFDASAAPILTQLPVTVSLQETPPTRCD